MLDKLVAAVAVRSSEHLEGHCAGGLLRRFYFGQRRRPPVSLSLPIPKLCSAAVSRPGCLQTHTHTHTQTDTHTELAGWYSAAQASQSIHTCAAVRQQDTETEEVRGQIV